MRISVLFKASLFLITTLLCACSLSAQSSVHFDYLEGDNDFVFPDTALDRLIQPANYKAFFYGETHTRFFEPMFKLHYIKYLNAKYGVRDAFMEMGYSAAVLFNQYLATGDTSLIDLNVLYTTKYYMELWKQLYIYNLSLPADKKIRIHGVDFESRTVFKALLVLKPAGKEIPLSLIKTFKSIEEYSTDSTIKYDKGFFNKIDRIKKDFTEQAESVKAFYARNMYLVNAMLRNDITMTDKKRGQRMYQHMQNEIKENNIDKFLGFYGGDHINYSYPTALPNAFKADKNYNGRIVSIRMFCFNAYDNWSHETLECIGTYSEEEGSLLHKKYINDKHRAVLIPDADVNERFLRGSSDFYLFANDK